MASTQRRSQGVHPGRHPVIDDAELKKYVHRHPDMTQREIAEHMGCSPSTVNHHLHAGNIDYRGHQDPGHNNSGSHHAPDLERDHGKFLPKVDDRELKEYVHKHPDMTQREIAEHMGCSPSTVSHHLHGKHHGTSGAHHHPPHLDRDEHGRFLPKGIHKDHHEDQHSGHHAPDLGRDDQGRFLPKGVHNEHHGNKRQHDKSDDESMRTDNDGDRRHAPDLDRDDQGQFLPKGVTNDHHCGQNQRQQRGRSDERMDDNNSGDNRHAPNFDRDENGRFLPKVDDDELMELADANKDKTQAELGEELGVAPSTISRHLHKIGLK